MRVVGYVRVSTREQGDSRLGLDAQRAAVLREVLVRGWELIGIEEEVLSGRDLRRPGLDRVLGALARGDAEGLVVAKLDRLGRSVHDVSGLFKRAVEEGWSLVSLSPAVDMTDPFGKAMAHMALVFAELERDMVSQRTREALAAKRASGWVPGAPRGLKPAVEAQVRELREAGRTYEQIAHDLNREGVRASRGGAWGPSSVQMVLKRSAVA